MAANPSESELITSMKEHMLTKIKTRYTNHQIKFLKACSLLDVRYKSEHCVSDGWPYLMQQVRDVCEQEDGQNEVPATEGQELINISSRFHMNSRNDVASDLFAFGDDMPFQIPDFEDILRKEVSRYKELQFTRKEKEELNILKWWKDNKNTYPSLFKAAKSMLHIPATSVPAERIFLLAGHIVRLRRSRLFPINVNQFIFLSKNLPYIPAETSIMSYSCDEDEQ